MGIYQNTHRLEDPEQVPWRAIALHASAADLSRGQSDYVFRQSLPSMKRTRKT